MGMRLARGKGEERHFPMAIILAKAGIQRLSRIAGEGTGFLLSQE